MNSLHAFYRGLCLGTLLSSCRGLGFYYPNTVEVEKYLKAVNRNYSSFTHLHSIGKSVEGRDLWVLVLGKFPNEHRTGIPEFKYVGNMHGNEVTGRVLLLHLIQHLTSGYLNDPTVTLLLNTTRIHILPCMNPDGYNKHGVDLNRNFPDAFEANLSPQEPETQAVIDWLNSEQFVLSANLHGGAVVASYPYDNGEAKLQGNPSLAPDDDIFVHLARTYSFNHTVMHLGNSCADGTDFKDGITNGYYWYPVKGGMQDYNYVWAQCLEITLELSCCKYPPEEELPGLWAQNKAALLAYMQQVHLGVKGQVLDFNGSAVQGALVEVEGRNNLCPFRTDRNGEYYRLLLPGNYTFRVTIPGQGSMMETLSIPYGPERFTALTHNFVFKRIDNTTIPSNSTKACNSGMWNVSDKNCAALLVTGVAPLMALVLRGLLL